MIDLDELERIAKAATPGPWIAGDDEDSDFYLVGPHQHGLVSNAVVKTHDVNNADHIAAFNPTVAQELIHRLREAEQDRNRINWLADPNNNIGNVQLPTECVLNNLHSLRAAIDAAMNYGK